MCPSARKQIAALRERNEPRAAAIDDHDEGLEDRRHTAIENVKKEMKRTRQKWSIVQTKIADARSYLCYEAASLYSLKQRRRRGGVIEYYIGGNPIPSLNDLPGTVVASEQVSYWC